MLTLIQSFLLLQMLNLLRKIMMATTEKNTPEQLLETTGKTADDKLGEEEERESEEESEDGEEVKEIGEDKDEVFNLPTPRKETE